MLGILRFDPLLDRYFGGGNQKASNVPIYLQILKPRLSTITIWIGRCKTRLWAALPYPTYMVNIKSHRDTPVRLFA